MEPTFSLVKIMKDELMTDKSESEKRTICVVGMGYIGLPTSALLASRGYSIHGVDVIQKVIDTINNGRIHIVEPDLDVFVREAVASGRLKCSIEPAKADVFIIAVPTPFKDVHEPDLSYVEAATESIAPYVEEGNLVILESTSPVGATERIKGILADKGVDTDKVFIAHCPERVLPGHIMKELVENDRIVGGLTVEATEKAAGFYREFVQGEVLETNAKTAEMTKLAENSYRDTNIAFANELSLLGDKYGIDAWEVIRLANRHPRVNILQPGVGVGGHCISVDPWFLISGNEGITDLMQASRKVNLSKTEWVISKIKEASANFEQDFGKKPKIAAMGLAYKPNIDDLRESPALDITKKLIDEGYDILPVEPNLKSYKDFEIVDYKDAMNQADIVVFLVSHNEFISLEPKNYLDFCGIRESE